MILYKEFIPLFESLSAQNANFYGQQVQTLRNPVNILLDITQTSS